MRSIVLVAMISACASSSVETQAAKLGNLAYDAPADWHHTDTHEPRSTTATWVPTDNNERKESLIVIRSQLDPALAKAGAPEVERLLAAAQRELPQLSLSKTTTQFVTDHGLTAMRLEADFVPVGQKSKYHRTHIALIDGATLIHLIYTSPDPDPEQRALISVLQSIHHEET